jgi:hypothetical protein
MADPAQAGPLVGSRTSRKARRDDRVAEHIGGTALTARVFIITFP